MTAERILPDRAILLATVRDYFEQLREEGLEGPPTRFAAEVSTQPVAGGARSAVESLSGEPAAASTRVEPAAETARLFSLYPGLERTSNLEELRAFVGDCQRCKLAGGRTNLVFGVGNPQAELMFIGEGPGADEDLRGEPFVGRAGQLLTDIIERGMGMRREDVYICNVVKCRPPGNRNPQPDEVAACEPFMHRQIDLVRPRAIVGLGTFAVQALLGVRTPISRLRGVWHEVRGIKMMPTFHPAYLLRTPSDKRLVWRDIQEVMKMLGRAIPKRSGQA